MADDAPNSGGRALATRRSGRGGGGAGSPAKRRLDVLERDATPFLGRDPRGDAPFSSRQRVANRFLAFFFGSISAISLASIASSHWLAAGETSATVEQERIIRDQRYLQGLTAATASGRELQYLCAAAPVVGASDERPGSAWWDVRKRCEGLGQ